MLISDWSSDVCSSALVHAVRRRVEQARSLAGALAAQLHELLLDPRARVTAGLYRALLLQHHLPCRIGAVLTQAQQGVEGVAFHPNNLRSASADCSNGTSSSADCCSSLRIGPIFSIAMSASGSVPRLYSPSCSSSSISWYLARYLNRK